MLCCDCDKRDGCVELCYDMRQELKTVTGGRRERLINKNDDMEQDAFYRDYTNAFKGESLKKVIIDLHNQGKTEREIAYYHGIGCGKTYVHYVIERYESFSGHKRKMRKRKHDKKLSEKKTVTKAISKGMFFHNGFFDKWR